MVYLNIETISLVARNPRPPILWAARGRAVGRNYSALWFPDNIEGAPADFAGMSPRAGAFLNIIDTRANNSGNSRE
jgi:hypothetical protein